jgi:hypothetical protein
VEVSVTEASIALGFRSRSTIYRLLKNGSLSEFERTSPTGARRLELDGLADTVRRLIRRQVNSTISMPSTAPAQDWWGDVAHICNRYLEVDCWGPPPWSALQWSVLVGVAQMADEELSNAG